MKPRLLIGLGNPVAGDDAIACHVLCALRHHPDLPDDVEVVHGGTDLLRLDERLLERQRILVLDALLDGGPPGRLLRFDGDLHELDEHGGSVHHLPPVQALRLLRCLYPDLRRTPLTFLGITVSRVTITPDLSPALRARIPTLVRGVLDTLE